MSKGDEKKAKEETSLQEKDSEPLADSAPVAVEVRVSPLDPNLGTGVARFDARSAPVVPETADMLHCSMCKNLAPVNPDRPDWVMCPRCQRQPAVERVA